MGSKKEEEKNISLWIKEVGSGKWEVGSGKDEGRRKNYQPLDYLRTGPRVILQG